MVTRRVPDYGLVLGNPGRLVGYVCYCGDRLGIPVDAPIGAEVSCKSCGKLYAMSDSQLTLRVDQ